MHLPPDLQDSPPPAEGCWARFKTAHLFDYNAEATRLWCLLALAGLVSISWALWRLGTDAAPVGTQVLLGFVCVAVAACFPVHIPRTKYSIGVADVFVFALLALNGAPVATLAAAIEGLVGVWRASRRLTSRVSTPAAATLAMAICGMGYESLQPLLVAAGGSEALSSLMALCLISLPYFVGTTLPLLAVVAVKNGRAVSLRQWAGDYSWLAAIYLLSAVVAGVLTINAHQFGPGVIAIAALVVAAVVALVHFSLAHQEAERSAQEARIGDAQRAAELNQQRFTAAFTHAAVGMAIVRPDGGVVQVNQALCTLLGFDEKALLGRPFSDLLHPGDVDLFRLHSEGDALSMELRCCDAGRHDIWVTLHCGRFIDPSDSRSGLIYQLHDITSRRLAEDGLHHIAYHDSLTDLANRSYFNERLGAAVESSRTDASLRFAVLFLDLDRFKIVNDSLGHTAGNLLLREVARRLGEVVRPGDLVARLGGDEFAVLLAQVHQPDIAVALAERLLVALSVPMLLNGTEVIPGASIGITFSDLGYRTADEMLRDADLAMYAAKAAGRKRVVVFDQTMYERITERLKLEGDLRHAIGEGQLSLAFQPLFDLEPYRLSGFEALARWEHPERGAVSPEVFIALAEESGHIEALTAWVLDHAVGQLAQWHAEFPQTADLCMHVNISGRDLAGDALVPLVRQILQRHSLQAGCLTLELTETTLMARLVDALVSMGELREMGVKFSIDDFGTGYSSLAYLSTLPIDSLKIDRSFVIGMDLLPQNVEIVRAVLDLGRSLGKKVIAEGIETAQQLAKLKQLGVRVGQGYLLSRPLAPNQVPPLFKGHVTERG